MHDAVAKELLYARRIPWKFGNPPKEDVYLVTVNIGGVAGEHPDLRSTRLEWFDGQKWPRSDAPVIAWDYRPRPFTSDL